MHGALHACLSWLIMHTIYSCHAGSGYRSAENKHIAGGPEPGVQQNHTQRNKGASILQTLCKARPITTQIHCNSRRPLILYAQLKCQHSYRCYIAAGPRTYKVSRLLCLQVSNLHRVSLTVLCFSPGVPYVCSF